MSKSLLDDPIKRPSKLFWLTIVSVSLLAIGGTLYAYPRIFPNSANQLSLFNVKRIPNNFQVGAEQPSISTQPSSLPLQSFTDSISGFSLKIPTDWLVDSATGLITIKSDSCGSSSAVLYPIAITDPNLTPHQFLSSFSEIITNQLATGGESINFGDIDDSETGLASVIFTGKVCDKQIKGSASASSSQGKGLIRMSWAPQDTFDELDSTLKEILRNYRLTGSASFLEIAGSKVEIAAPSNWTVTEKDQTIAVESNNKRVLATALALEADDSPETAIDNLLTLEQDSGYEMTDLSIVSNQSEDILTNGQNWSTSHRIIEFTNSGQRLRAGLTSATYPGLNGALVSWKQAPLDDFTESDLQLAAIEKSIILIAKSGLIENQNESLTLPLVFTQESDSPLTKVNLTKNLNTNSWRNVILGYERVQSSSKVFLAPLSSQLPNGEYKNSQGDTLTPVN